MTVILYIGNKLSHQGFTPGVIETLGPLLEKEGYRVFYAGTRKCKLMRLVEMLWKAITTGRRVDYFLVDTYSTSAFWYAYLTALVAKLYKVPYIPILHGGDLPRRLVRSKRASERLFKKSYANVAVSGYMHDEFEKQGYKTVVIPNSIDINKYPFRLRDQCRPRLLWVRSFHRQYNPTMTADVLAQLLKKYPDAALCMVGPDKDGSMEQFRKYIKQKGIENHVRITGRLAKDEWIKLSEDYDFFINTTNVDNTPVSVIEAMALGMCVISTDPGGIPYLLNDGMDSLLVAPNDSVAMTNNVIRILCNPDFASEISDQARKNAEKFDWVSIKDDWIKILT